MPLAVQHKMIELILVTVMRVQVIVLVIIIMIVIIMILVIIVLLIAIVFSPKKYTDPIVQRRAGGALILRM